MQQPPEIMNIKLLPRIIAVILLALSLYGTSAWADSLENLRASGVIGESHNGFVVARDPAAKAEAEAINAKRRVIYEEKAAAQGVNVDQVGKVYAEEIFRKVPAGTWIQVNGQWVRK